MFVLPRGRALSRKSARVSASGGSGSLGSSSCSTRGPGALMFSFCNKPQVKIRVDSFEFFKPFYR